MTTRELVEQWFERVWNQRDADAIHELLSTPCHIEGLGEEPITSPAEFRNFHAQMLGLFPVLQVEIDEMVCDGELAAGIFNVNGTHGPTRREVSYGVGFTIQSDGRKLTKGRNVIDFLTALIQIEALPQDALDKGLKGTNCLT